MQVTPIAAVALFAAAGLAGPVHAQLPDAAPRGRVWIGGFTGTGLPGGMASRTGPSVAVERTTRVEHDGSLSSLSLRWSTYTLQAGQRIQIIAPTLESRTYFGPNKASFQGRYVVGGVGLAFSRNEVDNRGTHFLLSAGVGEERGRRMLEARWFRGQVDGESGFAVSLGTRLR